MKVMEVLKIGQEMLARCGIQMSQLEAGMLLAYLLNCERTDLYLDMEREISKELEEEYIAVVRKRCAGVPIQYIIKHKEFMGLDFYVDERVLIPRADTECIVEYVIEYAKNQKSDRVEIIDVGTGSGAISISLAYYLSNGPKAFVTAVDIDDGALAVAKKNAAFYGLEARIEFVHSDMFSAFNEEKRGGFDILVSNPPYIRSADIETLEKQARDFEPRRALDGGKDGLYFYRRLAVEALPFLKDGSLWVVEVGYDQAHEVADILSKAKCYRDICFIKDLQGYDRGVAAILDLGGASICWRN